MTEFVMLYVMANAIAASWALAWVKAGQFFLAFNHQEPPP